MKKGLMSLAVLGLAVSLASCTTGGTSSQGTSTNVDSSFRAGLISLGDETETYSKAHIDGFLAAAENLGIPESQLILKKGIPEEGTEVTSAANEMIADEASIIFTNSYGHQDQAYQVAKNNPNVTIVADTGDYAALTGLSNYKNAFTNIYEARYVSGYVGGLKLKELDAAGSLSSDNYTTDGAVKIGYVGAFTYAEVISGYTAFYLGVKAAYGKDVQMEVYFTDSWYDQQKEYEAARSLLADNCVLIGQHADSTGAPSACQEAYESGKQAYSIGYNVDMLSTASDAALTSATNVWEVYYEYALGLALEGKASDVSADWAKGYNDNAVAITTLGPKVAEGTAEAVSNIESQIKAGTLKVFDTSTFTVDGETITSHEVNFSKVDYSGSTPTTLFEGETKEVVKTENGVTYVEESVERSAPYFDLQIDGISWVNK